MDSHRYFSNSSQIQLKRSGPILLLLHFKLYNLSLACWLFIWMLAAWFLNESPVQNVCCQNWMQSMWFAVLSTGIHQWRLKVSSEQREGSILAFTPHRSILGEKWLVFLKYCLHLSACLFIFIFLNSKSHS